jgi:hypothetical protein
VSEVYLLENEKEGEIINVGEIKMQMSSETNIMQSMILQNATYSELNSGQEPKVHH